MSVIYCRNIMSYHRLSRIRSLLMSELNRPPESVSLLGTGYAVSRWMRKHFSLHSKSHKGATAVTLTAIQWTHCFMIKPIITDEGNAERLASRTIRLVAYATSLRTMYFCIDWSRVKEASQVAHRCRGNVSSKLPIELGTDPTC